jgi:hypothetical protein
MSAQRSIAQRNNNNSQIIPESLGLMPDSPSFSDTAVYKLTLPTVQHTQGIFYVDLSGRDSSGNLLNVDGLFTSVFNNSSNSIHIITFMIDVPEPAAYRPGFEFTIFFKNIPFDRLEGGLNLLTIGLVNPTLPPLPYILCPPFPTTVSNVSSSVTLKSDGEKYNVVSSGPAGWMGAAALSVILGSYID